VSSRSRLNYTGTHWLLYTTGANGFFFVAEIGTPKLRFLVLRHFGSPKHRPSVFRGFGSLKCRLSVFRHFGKPKCRSRTTGNITCKQKSTTPFNYDTSASFHSQSQSL